MAKYTAAQARSAAKYLAGFDEIRIRVPKGRKAEIMQLAQEQNKSMNQYIIEAIKEKEGK